MANKHKAAERALQEWARSGPTSEELVSVLTLLSAELRKSGAVSLGLKQGERAAELLQEAADELGEMEAEALAQPGWYEQAEPYSLVVDGGRNV